MKEQEMLLRYILPAGILDYFRITGVDNSRPFFIELCHPESRHGGMKDLMVLRIECSQILLPDKSGLPGTGPGQAEWQTVESPIQTEICTDPDSPCPAVPWAASEQRPKGPVHLYSLWSRVRPTGAGSPDDQLHCRMRGVPQLGIANFGNEKGVHHPTDHGDFRLRKLHRCEGATRERIQPRGTFPTLWWRDRAKGACDSRKEKTEKEMTALHS